MSVLHSHPSLLSLPQHFVLSRFLILLSVEKSFGSAIRRNCLTVTVTSWCRQPILTARRTSWWPGSSLDLNMKFWKLNFEKFFTVLFSGERPYYITDYILSLKLLKFHLYRKSFVKKAMVLLYPSEKTPYVRVIDILPNIWETQSYLFRGDIFSGYT